MDFFLYRFYLLAAMFCTLTAATSTAQRRDMKAFEHVAVSIQAGTLGFGPEAATPIHPNLALRGGFSVLPVNFSYTYDGVGDNGDLFTIPMDAKVRMFNGKLLVDYFPVRDSRFHITGGLIFGSNRIIKVTGHSEYSEPIEIGDIWINPDEFGGVTAKVKTNAVKPYLGFGFGRTIPRRRFGFKFELGAMFQGSPKIVTDNEIISGELIGGRPEANDLNKFLDDYFQVYPVLSFQLSYRIF